MTSELARNFNKVFKASKVDWDCQVDCDLDNIVQIFGIISNLFPGVGNENCKEKMKGVSIPESWVNIVKLLSPQKLRNIAFIQKYVCKCDIVVVM